MQQLVQLDRVAIAAGVVAFGVAHRLTAFAFAAWPGGPGCYLPRSSRTLGGLVVGGFYDIGNDDDVGVTGRKWANDATRLPRDDGKPGGKRTVAFRVGTRPRVVVCDPADLEHCLVKHPSDRFMKRGLYSMFENLMGQYSLVVIEEPALHRQQRQLVGRAFAPSAVQRIAADTMAPHIAKLVSDLLAKIDGGSGTDAANPAVPHQWKGWLADPLDAATLAIIGEAAFATQKFESLRHAFAVFANLPVLQMVLLGPRLQNAMPWLAVNRSMRATRGLLAVIVEEVVAAVTQKRQSAQAAAKRSELSPTAGQDGAPALRADQEASTLMEYMVGAPNLSQKAILDHSVTFVLAGHDTTATALIFTLYHLARHPDAQARLFEELQSSVAVGTVPAPADVEKLLYLKACIHEALRLSPPVISVPRQVQEDDVLPSGTFVPKGCVIQCSITGAHYLEATWGADATQFRPERWLEPGDDGKPHQFASRAASCAFIPFLSGPRNCIGKDFAMKELAMSVASLVRAIKFAWPAGQPAMARAVGIVSKARRPFDLILTRRDA